MNANALTKAELAAKVEELEAKLEKAEADNKRVRFYSNLWPNNKRRTEKDPAWQGVVRLVIDGKAHHFDISQWTADPKRFKQNPPDFSLSMSETPEARAAELEARREKDIAEKAGLL